MDCPATISRTGPIVLIEPEINPITARIGLTTIANYPPLSLVRLAGQFPDEEDVRIVDLRVPGEKKRFLKAIQKDPPALVGISTTFTSNGYEAIQIMQEIRRISPQSVILLGGTAPSEEPMSFYDTEVDFIGFRSGDTSLPELVRLLRQEGEVPDKPRGFFYRKNGKWELGDAIPDRNISQIRPTAWHRLPSRYWKHYYQGFLPMGITQASEGCPYDCNFCSVWITHGRRIHVASLENLQHDFRSLPPFIQGLFFADDIWMQGSEKQIQELYDPLLKWICDDYSQKREKLKLTIETRTDLFLREKARFKEWVKRGRLQRVLFGVEAVTDEKLKSFSKRNTVDHNSEAIRLGSEMGLHVTVQMVIPLDADRAYFDEILRFYQAHRKWIWDINYTVATPLPGTLLYKDLVQRYPDLADRNRVKFPAFSLFTALAPTHLATEEFYERFAWLYQETACNGSSLAKKRATKKLVRLFKTPWLIPKLIRAAGLLTALGNPKTYLEIHRFNQGERLLTQAPQGQERLMATGS